MDFNSMLEQGPALVISYGIKLSLALIIFFIGKWIAHRITKLLSASMEKRQVDVTVARFMANLFYAVLLTVVIIATLGQLGIQTTSFIAILGAAGLAIGFALQGSLSNFASGVLMLLFRPIKVGDYVEAGGASGTVEEISVFATTLNTPDNKVIIVPNAAIMGGNIINYSSKPTRRVDLVIGVSYDADLKQVRQELETLVNSDERILQDPAVTIAVSELADSSVNFVVRPWVKSADYWDVFFGLQEQIKIRFDEVGIGIPYPQMDIHLPAQTVLSKSDKPQ